MNICETFKDTIEDDNSDMYLFRNFFLHGLDKLEEREKRGMERGMERGANIEAKKAIIKALRTRFPQEELDSQVIDRVMSMSDKIAIDSLFVSAITCPSIEEFVKEAP